MRSAAGRHGQRCRGRASSSRAGGTRAAGANAGSVALMEGTGGRRGRGAAGVGGALIGGGLGCEHLGSDGHRLHRRAGATREGLPPWTSSSSQDLVPRRRWRFWPAGDARRWMTRSTGRFPFRSPGRLDLHLFHPRDVPALLDAYLPVPGCGRAEAGDRPRRGLALGRRVRGCSPRGRRPGPYRPTGPGAGGDPGDAATHPKPGSEPSQGPPRSPSETEGVGASWHSGLHVDGCRRPGALPALPGGPPAETASG
jgi:hypothetical protein